MTIYNCLLSYNFRLVTKLFDQKKIKIKNGFHFFFRNSDNSLTAFAKVFQCMCVYAYFFSLGYTPLGYRLQTNTINVEIENKNTEKNELNLL